MSPVKGCHVFDRRCPPLIWGHHTCLSWHCVTHPPHPIPRISTPVGQSPPIFWRQNPQGAVNVVPPFNNQRNIFLTPLSLMSSHIHWVAIMYPLVAEEQTLVLFSRPYLRSLGICRQMSKYFLKISQFIPSLFSQNLRLKVCFYFSPKYS